jgi:hypothetical protein
LYEILDQLFGSRNPLYLISIGATVILYGSIQCGTMIFGIEIALKIIYLGTVSEFPYGDLIRGITKRGRIAGKVSCHSRIPGDTAWSGNGRRRLLRTSVMRGFLTRQRVKHISLDTEYMDSILNSNPIEILSRSSIHNGIPHTTGGFS